MGMFTLLVKPLFLLFIVIISAIGTICITRSKNEEQNFVTKNLERICAIIFLVSTISLLIRVLGWWIFALGGYFFAIVLFRFLEEKIKPFFNFYYHKIRNLKKFTLKIRVI